MYVAGDSSEPIDPERAVVVVRTGARIEVRHHAVLLEERPVRIRAQRPVAGGGDGADADDLAARVHVVRLAAVAAQRAETVEDAVRPKKRRVGPRRIGGLVARDAPVRSDGERSCGIDAHRHRAQIGDRVAGRGSFCHSRQCRGSGGKREIRLFRRLLAG